MDSSEKKPWESKTIWASFIVAAAAFVPVVHTWIVANPDTYSVLLAGLFTVLRTITKDKISIS